MALEREGSIEPWDSKVVLDKVTFEPFIRVMGENCPEFVINDRGQYIFNRSSFLNKLVNMYKNAQSRTTETKQSRPFYRLVNTAHCMNELLYPDFLNGGIVKRNLQTYLDDLSHTSYHGLIKTIHSLCSIYNDCCAKTFPTNFVVGTLLSAMRSENLLKSYHCDARYLGYKLEEIPLDLISFITGTPQTEYKPPENMPQLRVDRLAFEHFSDKLYEVCRQCHLIYRLVVKTGQYWVTWPNDGIRICYDSLARKIRIQCWNFPVYLTEITLNDVHSRRTCVQAGDHELGLSPFTTHLYVSCKNDKQCICRSGKDEVAIIMPEAKTQKHYEHHANLSSCDEEDCQWHRSSSSELEYGSSDESDEEEFTV